MSTFITRLETTGTGPTLAVKDLIDVKDVPTTAGSRAVQKMAKPATCDAPLLAGARAANARIVGKANLHELAMLPLGTNNYFGTPVNPLDPSRIPGGSSSGSAVAVANEDALVALGSDTGGSIRIPSACCGTSGLKTTHGRVSLEGVWPLSPSLDTVGPMAKDIAGLIVGMQLLEPQFTPSRAPARRIGRVRTTGQPEIERAIDEALARAEFEVVEIELDLAVGAAAFSATFFTEVVQIDGALVRSSPGDVGDDIVNSIELFELFTVSELMYRQQMAAWSATLEALFEQVELLALPTLPIFAPRLSELGGDLNNLLIEITSHVAPFNAAGVPALAQPVPVRGGALPASLQLVGPRNSEELLVTTALLVQAAVK